ncbi:barstar family protein [Kitasatospora sp. NPDC094019]|uniref:barstar family protein n=1 Tax=Kitasatospora sp. NPDC094019 TaxID=3364091 RepID=UPI003819070A
MPAVPESPFGPARWDLLPGRAWAGRAAGADGLRLVRGADCRSTSALFGEWARALSFPGYFGHNWDAFEECLNDALRPPGGGAADIRLLVLVTGADALLVDEPPDQLAILVAVLDACATDSALRVLFATTPAGAAAAEARLRAAGRRI